MNRLIGVPRWNRSGENLGKFIDSLNGCLGDYTLLSRSWNVKSLSVAVASEHRPKPEESRASSLESNFAADLRSGSFS
jgi:hypothetical protein